MYSRCSWIREATEVRERMADLIRKKNNRIYMCQSSRRRNLIRPEGRVVYLLNRSSWPAIDSSIGAPGQYVPRLKIHGVTPSPHHNPLLIPSLANVYFPHTIFLLLFPLAESYEKFHFNCTHELKIGETDIVVIIGIRYLTGAVVYAIRNPIIKWIE